MSGRVGLRWYLRLVEHGTVAGVQLSSKDPVLGVFPYRGLISTEGVPLPAFHSYHSVLSAA